MKLFVIKIFVIIFVIVILEIRFPYVDGFDPYVAVRNMGLHFENFFFGIKDIFVNMGRNTSYGWYIAETAFEDKDVAWEAKAAEYFYYSEYRGRNRKYRRRLREKYELDELSKEVNGISVSILRPDKTLKKYCRKRKFKKGAKVIEQKLERARERLRYEFYCSAGLQMRRTNLCQWALLNKKVEDRLWEVDRHMIPACEYRRVKLHHHPFETEGTFLRCSYRKQNSNDQPNQPVFTAYIKAVKNPAEYRLILYWLEEDVSPIRPPESLGYNHPDAGRNSLHQQPHVSYPTVQMYPMETQQYYWSTNQQPPPNVWNSNIGANSQPPRHREWKPVGTSDPNPYVILDPVTKTKPDASHVGRTQTDVTSAQRAQEFEAVNSKPALRVVYLLLNRRFSHSPQDALY